MKINHHQIKNAIAHVSRQLERKFPNKKLKLLNAQNRGNGWSLEIDEPSPMLQPDGSIIYQIFQDHRSPRYLAKFDEIGTDESISLDNIFIETFGIGKVVDAGWGFMNHVEKITRGELIGIYPANSYLRRYPSWMLKYDCMDNKQADVKMLLYVSNQGVIFNVEFIYTKGEKARELAENFMKQSGEVQNPQKIYQDFLGRDKSIHDLWYRGFNLQGEVVYLTLEIDSKNETILSHKITVLKSGNERKE